MRVTLRVVKGPHAGRSFTFEQHDTFFVGRSVKAQFSLPKHDRYFSRMHFLVEINPPLVRVTDLGSRNGTRVNGVRVESADLRHGDRIRAGQSVIEVAIADEVVQDYLLPTLPAGSVEELASRFEEDWRAARGPRIEDFLPDVDDAARPAVLRELAILELELRLDAGDPARVEDYLRRFKELKTDARSLADLVVAECTFRRRREAGLDTREYERRFPALWTSIAERVAISRPDDVTVPDPGDRQATTPGPPRIPGFKLEEVLGRGGMGVVYRGVREADGRPVAVKTIIPAVAAGGTAVERFLREADILRQLNHRHIVAFRAVGETNGVLWLAMDLVQGTDAAKLVSDNGPLETSRAIRLMLPVLGALTYAHARGFVHRDIKPGNVLVAQGPAGEEARLADFGLARTYQASQLSGLTVAGAIAGTPIFMAPEQLLSLREVKPAADQYSVAATLYFLLSGHPPYDRAANTSIQLLRLLNEEPVSLLERRPDLPVALERVIHRALAREPKDRFPGIAAFSAALNPFAC
jgi:serine/threonine-protein kinase